MLMAVLLFVFNKYYKKINFVVLIISMIIYIKIFVVIHFYENLWYNYYDSYNNYN